MCRFLPALVAAALLTSGCGYVGDPLTPLANVPGKIDDLAAIQRGSLLLVHFTVPPRTTEGVAIKSPLTLDLRVGIGSEPFQPAEWAPNARLIPEGPVTAGVASYRIPVNEWIGKEVVIAARAVASRGKDSGWSNPVAIQVIAPPPRPVSPKAQAAADGVRLAWEGAGGDFRIFRRAADEKSFAPVADVQQTEWTDRASEFGKRYAYQVQRIVKLDGGKTAESDPSDEVDITPVDTFPPAVPSGLRATAAPNSIELTWEQNAEPDLAGYRIYRASAGRSLEKIADTSQIPSYSDHKVEAGKTYQYAVSSVDHTGNESAKSAVVEVTQQ